ncbi:MAG: hypothetical protein ABIS07_07995 [Dokdonella sp.]
MLQVDPQRLFSRERKQRMRAGMTEIEIQIRQLGRERLSVRSTFDHGCSGQACVGAQQPGQGSVRRLRDRPVGRLRGHVPDVDFLGRQWRRVPDGLKGNGRLRDHTAMLGVRQRGVKSGPDYNAASREKQA